MRIMLVLSLAACSGDSEPAGSLDCAYLASSDNCWKTTASAAASCLPAANTIGVLAADNQSCTYASGQVITFATALTLPLPDDMEWDFTVTTNGEPCLHYSDSRGRLELTVGGDTVREELVGQGLELTCPDGSAFANSNAIELLSCPDSNFGDLPGYTSGSGATSVSFGLLNTGMDTLDVFECQR
jgi:hypothetical protein